MTKTAWPGQSKNSSSESLRKFQRDKGGIRVVFVLDVSKYFGAGLGPTRNALLPLPAQFVCVPRSAQPDVCKRRSQFDRSGVIVGVVNTKSHGMLAQECVNVACKPRFMPKFKGSRNSTRKHRQKCLKFLHIALEEWR